LQASAQALACKEVFSLAAARLRPLCELLLFPS
jgi:hypothetical protein